jgi:hypothetical protein
MSFIERFGTFEASGSGGMSGGILGAGRSGEMPGVGRVCGITETDEIVITGDWYFGVARKEIFGGTREGISGGTREGIFGGTREGISGGTREGIFWE